MLKCRTNTSSSLGHTTGMSDGSSDRRDYHTLEDRLAQRVLLHQAFPGLPHPLNKRGSTLHDRGRCLSPTTVLPYAHGSPQPPPSTTTGPGSPRLLLRATPGLHYLRRPARPGPAPRPGRAPAPLPAPAEPRLVVEFLRLQWPTGGRGAGGGGGRASASRHYTGGEKRSHRSPGSGGSSLALGQRSRAVASDGIAGCRAGWRSENERRGEGGGMPGAASFLLHHRGSRSQAGRPRTLAHFLTASRSVCLSLTPHSHTHSPPPPHTLTPGRPRSLAPSLPHSPVVRARATPLTHSARDASGDRPALPQTEAPRAARPRAEDPRAPRPRPLGAAARRAGGGGRWPAGQGAGPARGAELSGSNTCVGTRPPGSGSPLAAIAGLSGGEGAMEGARWEGNGGARALRGRAFPTRPQTVLTKEGKRVGGRGLFPTPNRKIDSFRCTPSPPSQSS